MVQSTRRSFLTGLGVVMVAAPAIVRAGSLMPVKTMIEPVLWADPDYTAIYVHDGVRLVKCDAVGDWEDVSSKYYAKPTFDGSIGRYQGFTFIESCA